MIWIFWPTPPVAAPSTATTTSRASCSRPLQLTTEGYALTYRLQEAEADGKWHKVTLRIDCPYKLQYRRAYYAANAIPSVSHQAAETRRVLRAEADQPAPSPEPTPTSPAAPSEPAANSKPPLPTPASPAPALTSSAPPTTASPADRPLIFTAHVLARRTNNKTGEVAIRYVIPTDQLLFDGASGGHAHFRLAALAYNADGDVVSHAWEVIDTRYNADEMRLAARIGTAFRQRLCDLVP